MTVQPGGMTGSRPQPNLQHQAYDQALIPLDTEWGKYKPSPPAVATSSGLRSDSGPLMCPRWKQASSSSPTHCVQPSGREVEWPSECTAQLNSKMHLVLVVKLLSPQNSSLIVCGCPPYFIL